MYKTEALFALYRRPQFYVYMPVVVLVIVGMLMAIRGVELTQRTMGSNSPEYLRVAKFHRFSYACISGIAGAQSIMFAKTTCVACLRLCACACVTAYGRA